MNTYRWEIIFMEEVDSVILETDTDDIATAARLYQESYGDHMKVYAIRLAATTTHYEEAI